MLNNIKPSFKIVSEELRKCYDTNGIVAGRGHYDEYWTRDAAFGCLGALLLNDTEPVERYIKYLSLTQRNDGMISFLTRKYFALTQHLDKKIKAPQKPRFKSHKFFGLTDVIDSNPYFIIVLAELIKKTNDKKQFEDFLEISVKTLKWCISKMDQTDLLSTEGPIAGWNDGIYKSGKVLITNVLFYKAFFEWENLCKKYQIKNEFPGIAKKIKLSINKTFYNGKYYSDWFDTKLHSYFDSLGNLLAVWWKISNKDQSKKILEYARKNLLVKPFIKPAFPAYPWYRVELFNRLAFLADYINGNGYYWPEASCLYAICLSDNGYSTEAKEIIEMLSKNVIKNNGIHEVYFKNQQPVKQWNYTAEYPYARGSALFLLAFKKVFPNI